MVKAISSGVALDAAKMRSPSFSRSSSSTTTTALPAAMSAIASSTGSRRILSSQDISVLLRSCWCGESGAEHALDVLRDHVDLEVDRLARLTAAEGGAGEGLRDQRDG